jgi:hypothetical protein
MHFLVIFKCFINCLLLKDKFFLVLTQSYNLQKHKNTKIQSKSPLCAFAPSCVRPVQLSLQKQILKSGTCTSKTPVLPGVASPVISSWPGNRDSRSCFTFRNLGAYPHPPLQKDVPVKAGLQILNIAGTIALYYFVFFLRFFYILDVLVLNNNQIKFLPCSRYSAKRTTKYHLGCDT